jgi:hypothetical protein
MRTRHATLALSPHFTSPSDDAPQFPTEPSPRKTELLVPLPTCSKHHRQRTQHRQPARHRTTSIPQTQTCTMPGINTNQMSRDNPETHESAVKLFLEMCRASPARFAGKLLPQQYNHRPNNTDLHHSSRETRRRPRDHQGPPRQPRRHRVRRPHQRRLLPRRSRAHGRRSAEALRRLREG